MVTTDTPDVDSLAKELTDRLVRRGRVPERLAETAREFMRLELLKSLRSVARMTSVNAGALVALKRDFRF